MDIRPARVAGAFYPGETDKLTSVLDDLIDRDAKKKPAVALVSPHAGYIYSGNVAGALFSSTKLPRLFVLLGPSHSGIGEHFAIFRKGKWTTPLGDVPVDENLADLILSRTGRVREDPDSHRGEHALEVQVPFIQHLRPDCRIVPINNPYFARWPELEEVGRAVADAIRAVDEPVLIVASTDMSHQVSRETARRKDFLAIEAIRSLDARKLYEVVNRERISMCGFQATSAALAAAVRLGARRAELVDYRTSGDVTGDDEHVVGYAGIRIE